MNGTATDNQGVNYSPAAEGFMTYGVYFVLLNTIIPLSLVVSIEFIKLTQTPFMANDVQLYDPISMKQCQPMSMTLHEEMASISYIFADKTGTLTANVMQFKACSIGSVCYDEDYRDEDYEYLMDENDEVQSATPGQSPEQPQFEGIKEEDIALNESPSINMSPEDYLVFKQQNKGKFNESGKEAKTKQRRGSITKIVWNYPEAQTIINNLLFRKRYFINEETNLGQSHPSSPPLILRKQNDYLHQFWLTVALCHDVITTISLKQVGDKEEKIRNYQGTSPDEITLLDAAKEVGYSFLDRTSDTMFISIFEQNKTYRLLQKFEFTSERKKMTVVVQDEQSGQIILYSKGADLAIFDRLSQQVEQHFLDATKEDLIKFSTKGFRTLCFGIRVLDETYFKEWQHRYDTAKLESIKLGAVKAAAAKLPGLQNPQIAALDPNAMLLTLEHELESELFLLGATALEDKLQDGVPEAIEDFRNAGIKVWMLTGDKLETAENIGFSSKMFNEKMFIFKLQTPDKSSTRMRLQQIDQKIFDIEKQHATPVIGTQFILNPNAAMETYEARNIIQALEEFKHESRASEHTMNDSWARKPTLRRKMRKRLEEIVPDRNAIAERLIRESQVFSRQSEDQLQYIPRSFDLKGGQYIFKGVNVYRSAASQKMKIAKKNTGLQVGGINLNLMQTISMESNPTSGIIDNEDKFGILIEGHTLAYIQNSKSMKEKFLKILAKCEAVIVCRASPSQKGQVVEMIKESEPEAVTLAIGDGANDVNMIQKAHVGIGIFGKEGYQAAGSSDYAIGQFRFLRRLLFTHGRWNGLRLTVFMLLFFNKNLFFTMPQFWFGWNNGFSGQTYYDEVYMSAFNLFATNFAICGFAVWEQDLPTNDPVQSDLIELFLPQIYQYTKENELFTTKKFFGWSAVSLMQSLFVYGIPQFAYDNFIFENGKKQDFWAQSACSYFSIVALHYATSFFFTRNYTWWSTLIYLISVLTFSPFQIVTYDSLEGYPMSGRLQEMAFSSINFYLVMLVSVALCLIPFLFYFQANSLLFPSLKDLIVQSQVNQKQVIEEADPKKAREAMDMLKKKQIETLQKWDLEYNTFQKPTAQNAATNDNYHSQGDPNPITLVNTNNQTPQKSSHRKAPAGPGQSMLQKNNGPSLLEKIVEEESKHPFEDEIIPFQMVDAPEDEEELKLAAIAKNKADASPMRMSASRKGLNFLRQQSSHTKDATPNFGGGEPAKKRVSMMNEIQQPKTLSPIEDDTPLRITRSGASPSPMMEDGEIGVMRKEDEYCMTENDSINDASQLDNKMQIMKINSTLIQEIDAERNQSMMTKLNNPNK